MTSNAKCWAPTAAAPLIEMLWLTGCATGGSEGLGRVCPPVVKYIGPDQDVDSAKIEALPEGAVVIRMPSDYAVLRDHARACR